MEPEKLQNIRHTLAHLMAQAVKELYPNAQLTLGPAIDTGFYYDIDFGADKLSDADLPKIEKLMRKNLQNWKEFTHQEVDEAGAEKAFAGNQYKLELVKEISERGEKITLYTCGNFTDLCRGGHAENPSKDIAPDSFKLDRIAGAYWRGSEKNPMLTRIYGLAFESKPALDMHLTMLEEAKKRDHRKLGKELELFMIADEVGPGLPMFYPKGAILRRLIENYIIEEQEARGYVPIWIPHITKGKLYEISGHLSKYDAMYNPMHIDDDDYYLKPMNCPHFMMLYKSLPHSYKELPLRYTCTTTNYRYEKSGELSGLTRVRALTQDDCHVFCMPDQIENEIKLMLEMIGNAYHVFKITDFWVRISLRDSKDKSKYLGDDDVWNKAEDALRKVVKASGWKYKEAENEAAFYGPKLDFMMKDAIGREWQISTIQLDFNLPKRFELEYTSNTGTKEQPVVIHRAILGSTERFMGVLIEHLAGNFPTWLSPIQVAILPISDKHLEYSKKVAESLRASGVRVELNEDNDTLGKKIRNAKGTKVPYMLVIGDAEVNDKTITVEHRDKGKVGAQSVAEFIANITDEIKNRN
ncbi:MAG: threonine--tRNA ligase [Candidatus Paceibacterota bacterium]|jgi:threonyl-tRNA synthetase